MAQALADFIVQVTCEETNEPGGTWKISVDGSAAQTNAQVGVMTDSQLVSSQIEGTFEATEPVMQKYLSRMK